VDSVETSSTGANGIAQTTSIDARLAAQMESIITKRLAADRLVIPSLPMAAVKCLRLLKDPDLSLKSAAAVIEQDPVLAAQIIRLTNSAMYANRDPVKSVLAAVTKLGTNKLRGFLMEASARKVFESRDSRIGKNCRAVWEHSLAVAVLAKDTVAFSNIGDTDSAYLGGLLHDIGKPVVAALLLEAESAIAERKPLGAWIESKEWSQVIARVHRKVGVALAEKWELPEAVCRCVRDCDDYDNADRLSAVNAVRFANALAKREGLYLGDVATEDNDALIMIGTSLLGLEKSVVDRLTSGLRERVERLLA
jgi:putative nucleotidyltransferase with HDIG domain